MNNLLNYNHNTSLKSSVGSSYAGTVRSLSHASSERPRSSYFGGVVNQAIRSEKSSTTNPTQTSFIATSSRDSRSLTLASMGGLSRNRPPSYEGPVRYALGSETPLQFSGGVSFGGQVGLQIGSATSYPYYNDINFRQLVDLQIRSAASYPYYNDINFTQRVDLMITSDQPQNQYRYLQVAPLPSQHYFFIPSNQIIQQYDSTTVARKKTEQVPNTRYVVARPSERSPASTYQGHLNRDIIESYMALQGPVTPERMRIFGEAVDESQRDDERRRFYVQEVYGTDKFEGILLERAQGNPQSFQAIQEWIEDYWRRNNHSQEAWMYLRRAKRVTTIPKKI